MARLSGILTIRRSGTHAISYLAYRLIEPGYELWNQMGIYQRNLEDYKQSPIMENKYSGQNCMNCHSFFVCKTPIKCCST